MYSGGPSPGGPRALVSAVADRDAGGGAEMKAGRVAARAAGGTGGVASAPLCTASCPAPGVIRSQQSRARSSVPRDGLFVRCAAAQQHDGTLRPIMLQKYRVRASAPAGSTIARTARRTTRRLRRDRMDGQPIARARYHRGEQGAFRISLRKQPWHPRAPAPPPSRAQIEYFGTNTRTLLGDTYTVSPFSSPSSANLWAVSSALRT